MREATAADGAPSARMVAPVVGVSLGICAFACLFASVILLRHGKARSGLTSVPSALKAVSFMCFVRAASHEGV